MLNSQKKLDISKSNLSVSAAKSDLTILAKEINSVCIKFDDTYKFPVNKLKVLVFNGKGLSLSINDMATTSIIGLKTYNNDKSVERLDVEYLIERLQEVRPRVFK